MSIRLVKRLVVLLIFFSLSVSTPAFAVEEWDVRLQKEIEAYLVCQDDCGMILVACENQTAEYMRGIIIDKLKAGQTKADILNHFVEIYGEQVLAAPTVKGFNITAWVVPFIALIGGGLLVYFVLEKWVFQKRIDEESSEEDENFAPKLDLSEYEGKLEEELKKYL